MSSSFTSPPQAHPLRGIAPHGASARRLTPHNSKLYMSTTPRADDEEDEHGWWDEVFELPTEMRDRDDQTVRLTFEDALDLGYAMGGDGEEIMEGTLSRIKEAQNEDDVSSSHNVRASLTFSGQRTPLISLI